MFAPIDVPDRNSWFESVNSFSFCRVLNKLIIRTENLSDLFRIGLSVLIN